MKSGSRALGIAESYQGQTSTLAGCVLKANRSVDGLAFETCQVGGLDATDAIVTLVEGLDREDIQYLLVSGIAPAWFNIVDIRRLNDETGLPVLSVSYEESPGLEPAIRDAFESEEATRRLAIYRAQPDRRAVRLGESTRYVRAVGIEQSKARAVLNAFTDDGGRPEPLRVAQLAARAGDSFRRSNG